MRTLRLRQATLLGVLAMTAGACDASTTSGPPDAFPVLVAANADTLLGPWRTTPLALDPALLAAVERVCRTDMSIAPQTALVVADARGSGVIQPFYAGPDGSTANCMDLRVLPDGSLRSGGAGGMGSTSGVPPALPQPLELRPDSSSVVNGDGGQQARSLVSGRAGAGIAFVTIERPGQPMILASLANGWYAAWWPGPTPVGSKIVGYDAGGKRVVTSDLNANGG